MPTSQEFMQKCADFKERIIFYTNIICKSEWIETDQVMPVYIAVVRLCDNFTKELEALALEDGEFMDPESVKTYKSEIDMIKNSVKHSLMYHDPDNAVTIYTRLTMQTTVIEDDPETQNNEDESKIEEAYESIRQLFVEEQISRSKRQPSVLKSANVETQHLRKAHETHPEVFVDVDLNENNNKKEKVVEEKAAASKKAESSNNNNNNLNKNLKKKNCSVM